MEFFKKIKSQIDFLKCQWEDFKKLKPGDIVWAKMPLPRKKLKSIEAEHQVRPYLVVDKSRFFVYAYQSSSKKWNKAYNYQEYRINKLRYEMSKDSFITLTNVYKIPFVNLKKKYISLNEFDIKNIQKRLKILSSEFQYHVHISINEGDVIQIEKQMYYVYASDNVYLYCLIIFPSKPSNQYDVIKIDNRSFYTKFDKKVTLKRTDEMQISNIAFYEEIELILKQMKESKLKLKNANSNKSHQNKKLKNKGRKKRYIVY